MGKYIHKLITALRMLWYAVKLGGAYILSAPLRLLPRYQNIWLISERGDDARDNGFFFFDYLNRRFPGCSCYYVISRSSADYARACAAGKVVETNSWKHFVLFALAKVRISSHAWGGDIPCVEYYQKLGLARLSRKKTVFLQHGITKDQQPGLCHTAIKPDLFICGARPEYDYIRESFGHPEGVVKYTGFARFDNLHNVQTKQQILFMPTFRKWLQGKTAEEIQGSEFVANWNAALKDPRLIRILEEQNLELIFYPHYVLQPYVHLFSSDNPRIKIAKFAEYDVQQLLKESKLLITDFSSVFFDFAYMGKPVIYYQFDRERYIRDHYDFTKGYFSYDRLGFGPVCTTQEGLIECVKAAVQGGFAQPDTYARRTEQFFELRDTHNCDRIYDAIVDLL